MKNVRIFYKKLGRMKFVSHLDMNRLMSRIIRRAEIPVWVTEGFNKHIYINYAVPLSLGYEGIYEVLDFKLTEDDFSLAEMVERLNSVAPEGIELVSAAEPILPTKDIAYAEYEISFEDTDFDIYGKLEEFLQRESIICLKKDKKGRMKEFDIIPKIKSAIVGENKINLTLSAGNEGNLNPSMVLSAFFTELGIDPVFCTTKRLMIYDGELKPFK